MPVAKGIIVLAQETRFRLMDDEGRGRMFLLSHKADIEPQDLPLLQQAQSRVAVVYDKAPHLIADVAQALYLSDESAGDFA